MKRIFALITLITFAATIPFAYAQGGPAREPITIWNSGNLKPLAQFDPGDVTDVAISPDGQMLAAAAGTPEVLVYDLSQPNAEPRMLSAHEGTVLAITFNAAGTLLASASADLTILLWNLEGDDPPLTLTAPVVDDDADGDDGDDADGDDDDDAGDAGYVDDDPGDNILTMAFSPDDTLLATGSVDGTVTLWDIASLSLYGILPHDAPIHALTFSPDGTRLAVAAREPRASRLWDLATTTSVPIQLDTTVAFSPDGMFLAGGGNGTQIVDAATGNTTATYSRGLFGAVAYSPDGTMLAAGSTSPTDDLILLDIEYGGEGLARLNHPGRIHTVRWDIDQTLLVTAGTFGIIVWGVPVQ